MNSEPLTFLILIASVVVWWFAVRTIAGDWFGMFHWIPVAIACFGVPIVMADLMVQRPHLSDRLRLAWHGIGLLLAMVYLVRGVTNKSSRRAERAGSRW